MMHHQILKSNLKVKVWWLEQILKFQAVNQWREQEAFMAFTLYGE